MKIPKMTRSHFDFIASVINEMPTHSPRLRTTREECASAFARSLSETNPKFDVNKFLNSCLEEK